MATRDLLLDLALDGVFEGDAGLVEEVAEGVVQFDFGFLVVAAGGDLRGAGLGEVGLVLDDLEGGGLAELELVLFCGEELFLVAGAGAGGFIGGKGGGESDGGVLDVLADLVGELLGFGFNLAELDGVAGGVRGRDAVADGEIELDAGLGDGGDAEAAEGEVLRKNRDGGAGGGAELLVGLF